ncbi:MerR family transcriptional regulator [Asanoa siamensis]|uniref:Transcriptional regulator n=1 Tax=Asanoa siamensis TaxID=926357 RepID=A0ABQ4CTZ3_9ACTN|nr:MerR family transcriptional regulator [Asanoa siamensis]GIF74740.1 transcriptional regulator [Asanoa siamensis]
MADEALSAGAVARRLGVAVTTLRTWHQRYGLGPSSHVPGQHRRYTAEDLSRLEVMRRLTAEGIAPAEAARWARYAPDVPPPASTPREQPARAGGGFAIPVGRAGPTARGLARAAIRLDVGAMREIMARAVAEQGVVSTWDLVVRPVLAGIGERHMATKRLIEVEHLFSRTATEVLAAVPRPRAGAPARILLACTDEEQHSLPLEAMAAALAADGLASRLLGPRVPPTALTDTVERTGPAVVMLWSHAPETAHVAQLVALQEAPRRPVLILAAGPGWAAEALPAGVVAPSSLAEALELTRTWAR